MKILKLKNAQLIIIFFSLILGIVIIIKQTRYKPNNPKERNKLIFETSEKDIFDSLYCLGNIMEKLPTQDKAFTIIGVRDDIFLLNYKKTDSIQRMLLSENIPFDEFKALSINEFLRLLKLTAFTYKNHLYHIQYNHYTKNIKCLYRKFGIGGDYHYDLIRYICFRKNIDGIKEFFKILDTSKYFILYAEKDARIWEGE